MELQLIGCELGVAARSPELAIWLDHPEAESAQRIRLMVKWLFYLLFLTVGYCCQVERVFNNDKLFIIHTRSIWKGCGEFLVVAIG